MLKILGAYNWTDGLSTEAREQVTSAMQLRRFSDGETIYSVGEQADECFQVISGMVELRNCTYTGKLIVMVEFRAGDCFGEAGLIDNHPRYNTAVSIGETLLYALPKKSFNALYSKHEEIARSLNRSFCYRLRNVYCIAEDASILTLKERLVGLIARLGTSRGMKTRGATVLEGTSHQKLANMLGATRQAVSRELKALENDGLLQLHYGRAHIPDLKKLIALYEQLMSSEIIVPDYSERTNTARSTAEPVQ